MNITLANIERAKIVNSNAQNNSSIIPVHSFRFSRTEAGLSAETLQEIAIPNKELGDFSNLRVLVYFVPILALVCLVRFAGTAKSFFLELRPVFTGTLERYSVS